jgi:hypothetical protein
MHDEIKAFQRRLEHIKKSLIVVDGENTFFWTAITGSHTPRVSNWLASKSPPANSRRQFPTAK